MPDTKSALLLLSGGLDSAAHLSLAQMPDSPVRIVRTLTVDYGQRAARREIAAAQALSQTYGIDHEVLELRWLGALGGSALTDSNQRIPDLAPVALDNLDAARETARAVWVPNRNGVLAEAAAAIAEACGIEVVLLGFNREEAATFPDNSLDYMHALAQALQYSTQGRVTVSSLTVNLTKQEIAQQIGPSFPWELLWSCYTGHEKPCSQCESCRRLARVRG